ncbi:PaaX family transcriptional regulator C-terminal domain-containing protein [Kibdelosporangium phytohabitans]|uniref:PaaX family transcriptional regulator n=1 Tax=Kibdelosporangium phytohabitans TaxID=860235 RepID=A0A0N9II68_9PSEU|nr:PaaX family transcriptional regulator C-terminal domain-containing protein [Kibdelosporangium phytohabitans]ALG14699.1 PaaX family transcriptional regulator [Kibdelosporangium phytohabitans]
METAQPRHLIVTVYGLYARGEGGWMSVARLIGLMADLGVDQAAVRSSISRLKRRGMLRPRRQGGAAGYELSEEGLAILKEGDRRIFNQDRATLADGWLLAVFSVPESERNKRHTLRTQLTRLGFGTTAPGVWIAPAHLSGATEDMLRRLDLSGYADLFHSHHLAFGDLAGKVRRWWDLDQLERLYAEFVHTHSPAGTAGDDRAAFATYVRLLTDWRRLPYLDPGLPAELLPDNWVGIRAADLFFTLQAQLARPAERHAVTSS